jgi:hypothetical protein
MLPLRRIMIELVVVFSSEKKLETSRRQLTIPRTISSQNISLSLSSELVELATEARFATRHPEGKGEEIKCYP